MITPKSRRALPWVLGTLAVALFVWAVSGVVRRLLAGRRLDFYHFYEAAVAVSEGSDLYQSGAEGYIYPPLLAVMLAPLARLGHDPSAIVWLIINIALVILALAAGYRSLIQRFGIASDLRSVVCITSLTVILSSEQIRWQLILGQTDTLTVAACALALLWLDRRPLLAGAILGGISNIKYQAIAFLPYLLVRGRLLAGLALAASAVVVALLPALVVGWDRNLSYLAVAFGGMLELAGIEVERAANVPVLVWERSITITSGLGRILQAAGYNSNLAIPAAGLLGILILAVVWMLYRRHRIPLLVGRGGKREKEPPLPAVTAVEWCGMIIALAIFSPQGTKRHLFLLLLANLMIVSLMWNPRVPSTRWILLLGVAVYQMAIRLPPTPGFESAAAAWNFVGGPSWGILFLSLTLAHAGLQEARATRRAGPTPC